MAHGPCFVYMAHVPYFVSMFCLYIYGTCSMPFISLAGKAVVLDALAHAKLGDVHVFVTWQYPCIYGTWRVVRCCKIAIMPTSQSCRLIGYFGFQGGCMRAW